MSLDRIVEKEVKRMKLYKKSWKNPKDKKVIIIPFGDMHYGSKHCDIKSMKKMIKWVALIMGIFFVINQIGVLLNKTDIQAGTYNAITFGILWILFTVISKNSVA